MKSNDIWKVLSGQVINHKYHLRSLLGVGGFGAVFLADEMVGDCLIRQVAVKLLVSDGSSNQLNELIMATRMKHPNLLHYITGGECHLMNEDFRYLITELAETSLDIELKQRKLSDSQLRSLVKDIAEGLSYLHQHSVIHRDLKPGNILRIGSTWKIADFGFVKEIDKRTHVTQNIMGTPIYMSPEALRGKVNSAGDIWSLGVLIIEVLTGKFPYRIIKRTPEELMLGILHKKPKIPALSAPWHETVKGCLTKDYRHRWDSSDVLQALTSRRSFSFPIKSLSIWMVIMLGAIAITNLFQSLPAAKNPDRTIADTIPDSNLIAKCNRQTDDIFYRRHPELNRTPILATDLDAVKEWKTIRQNLTECYPISFMKSRRACDRRIDNIFFKRYPELEGKLLNISDRLMTQEWNEIGTNLKGCSLHYQ